MLLAAVVVAAAAARRQTTLQSLLLIAAVAVAVVAAVVAEALCWEVSSPSMQQAGAAAVSLPTTKLFLKSPLQSPAAAAAGASCLPRRPPG